NVESYAFITRSGYGRIDDTSYFDGLATFGVYYCVAVIGHCRELKRTVLINTHMFLDATKTLQPVFDWMVAKNEEKYEEHNSIEIVILRGYSKTHSQRLALKTHEGFARGLYDLLKYTYGEHPHDIIDARLLFPESHQILREIFVNDIVPMLFEQENGRSVKERHLQFD
ncbi:hypothetical protein Bhyg_04393, partial [Pseudolycoriella hygida]